MQFIFVILFAIFGFSQLSSAKIQIVDSQKLIPQVTAKLGSPKFSDLFVVGKKGIYDRYIEGCEFTCNDDDGQDDDGVIHFPGCGQTCKKFQQELTQEVISVDGEKAAVLSNFGDYTERSADDILQCQGNLAIPFLEELNLKFNQDGKFVVDKISEFNLNIIDNGPQKILKALSIWGKFYIDGYKTGFDVKISVAPGLSGASQIVMFSTMGTVWFKLKGIQ